MKYQTLFTANEIAALPALIKALRLAYDALYEGAKTAGDVPFWNKGGLGYKASEAARKALAKVQGA